MYFCKYDKGEMASMVYNWESDQVDAVVVTDGSRVLGLGDLGIGGLGISIGKLDLYVAAGGFHPRYLKLFLIFKLKIHLTKKLLQTGVACCFGCWNKQ